MNKLFLTTALALASFAAGAQTTPQLVDMGTSVLWAADNIGATADNPAGGYYQPGSLKPIYQGMAGNLSTLTKPYEIDCWAGDPQYDVATATYGAGWSTPTTEQFQELLKVCYITTDYATGDILIIQRNEPYNELRFKPAGYLKGNWTMGQANSYIMTANVIKGSNNFNYYEISTVAADLVSNTNMAVNVRPVYADAGGIKVEPQYLNVQVADKGTIKATVNSPDVELEWTSGDTSIITVDNNGNYHAMAPGDTQITVGSKDGSSRPVSIEVHVATRVVTIKKPASDIYVGDKFKFTLTPEAAMEIPGFRWSSNNPRLAVEPDGTAFAYGKGSSSSYIVVKVNNEIYPSISASYQVESIKSREITIDNVIMAANSVHATVMKFNPALDRMPEGFNWVSSDESVATVDNEGKITGIKPGKSTITVSNDLYDFNKVTFTVEVLASKGDLALVDMGTGVFWSTANLGSTDGHEFVPGGVAPYNPTAGTGLSNFAGDKLDCADWFGMEQYDAASVALGKNWRTPTRQQWLDLFANCDAEVDAASSTVTLTSRTTGNKLHFDAGELLTSSGVEGSAFDVYYVDLAGAVAGNMAQSLVLKQNAKEHPAALRPVCGILVHSVLLSGNLLEAAEEETVKIGVQVLPENATNPTLTWTSSNTRVATVDQEGNLFCASPGKCVITATANDRSGVMATCTVIVKEDGTAIMQAVDLGLSVVWSDRSVGATSVLDPGNYYLWGTMQYMNDGTKSRGADYPCELPSEPITGLLPDPNDPTRTYDIATATLGDGWTTPTVEQVQELYDNCTQKMIEENGVYFYRFTSNINGNYIDVPRTGVYRNGLETKGLTSEYFYHTSDAPIDASQYMCMTSGNSVTGLGAVPVYWMAPVRPVYRRSGISTGVDEVATDNGFDRDSALFDVYDIAGRRVASSAVYAEACTTLTPGIYVFVTTDGQHRLKVHIR